MSGFAGVVEGLADALQPVVGGSAAAAAIVLFTAFVRLLVLPLSLAAARGQKAKAALQPKIAELRKRYGRNPEKLQRAVLELHAREKVSPLSGCLPSLCQLPAFFLLYYLFSSETIGGRGNELLGHELFGAPLGGRWLDALSGAGGGGVFGQAGVVYLGVFAVVAAVAYGSYRLTRRMMAAGGVSGMPAAAGGDVEQVPGMAAVSKAMPFMSFFTLITVAVVPLAAALYVVTSTTWSLVERAVLYR
ncbi:YidC/Oxa1 family membrane protein insertase [Streptomyces sp. 15-116A]|uniref:YidC/Oxa1 family membrane protein insertase n=1 Tax=Streptomyces sp. 15-116A TaxID=2259035 RepID=UPI0021B1746C|nr:YidC/Oxa1 family membrane protein insertase [Streptomyces sp. 15-116A]MCT7351325.1 YidC/Oxa1 family membrane protein insertase [Streptomyces sp. 15-116A]